MLNCFHFVPLVTDNILLDSFVTLNEHRFLCSLKTRTLSLGFTKYLFAGGSLIWRAFLIAF